MIQQKEVRVGIIGLGAIAERMVIGFTNHPHTVISAICDISEARAQNMAEKLGGIDWFTDYKKLLEVPNLDLIYVAVPPAFHFSIVMDTLKAGKHILCEKPLANSREEAEAMMVAAKAAGVIHAMNFPLHYSAPMKKLEQLLKQSYVGTLRRVELNLYFPKWPRTWQENEWVGKRQQGGFVLEVGVHYIQAIQHLLGPIQNVISQLEYPKDPESCEIGILASMELTDGTPIAVNGISHVPGPEEIEFTVYGQEGILTLLNWGSLHGARSNEAISPISSDDLQVPSLLENLVQAIQGKPADLCDFTMGYEAQVILELLRHSTGNSILS